MGILTDLYIECVRRHNTALIAGDKYAQDAAYHESTGVLNCVRALYGDASAGAIICDADMAVMETYPDEPMCGGMLFKAPTPKEG